MTLVPDIPANLPTRCDHHGTKPLVQDPDGTWWHITKGTVANWQQKAWCPITPDSTPAPRRDPILHTHVTDRLPDDHPLAYQQVWCEGDAHKTLAAFAGRLPGESVLLHAGNNECMTTWVETGKGPRCLACFTDELGDDGKVVLPQWGLA